MGKNYLESDWIGKTVERRVTISAEMLDRFIAVSGDTSAIHVSESAAREAGFSGRVSHGMLLGALVSGIVGTELPGNEGVMQQAQLSFRAPCHPGDEIVIRLSVTDFFESVQTLQMDVKITKVEGPTLATGRIQTGLR